MKHKLSVVVRAYVDSRTIRILTTGCLTEASHQSLHALIQRARRLDAGAEVTVDLSQLGHVEAAGVDLLRWATDHDDPDHRLAPVRFVLPPREPACPKEGGLVGAVLA